MSDMLKRQMQALESIMYSDDDTATSTTEGLMGQGMSDSEPEDYVTSFVKYLRSKRDLDPAKAREEIPAVKARNVSITDEDIAKYEEEMSVFEQAKQSAMEARLQREASGITQSLTEEDVAVRAAVGDPEYGNKLDKDQTIMIDVTDTDEGKLSNEEPLYKMAEEIDPGTIDTDTIDADGGAAPSGKGIMSPRLDSKGETPEEPRIGDVNFSPIDESIKQKTTQFYLDIGQKAESDHGSVPKPTKDKREKNIPESQRSKDVGFGHKVKASEDASGEIHGIKFKNEDGTYIELTEAQKVEILNKDMAYELSLARKDSDGRQGWDSKLKKLGIKWDDLDYKYQNALTSLAYNVGGIKAGTGWTKVLQAAKDGDVKEFAKQMRRKDSGSFTAGMDNRVAKELYYAGIISNLDEVSSVLPKADYKVAGIPKSGAA